MAEQAAVQPSAPTEQTQAPVESTETQDSSGESQEAQQQVEALESKKDLTKTEKKRLKELKLKIDGQEYVEKLPFEIDDDPKQVEWMKRNLQMSKVAQKRMQEQAQLQKEVEMFIQELRANPKKLLSDPSLGIDVKKLVQEIIDEDLANAQKSPEQLDREKLENELKSIKEEREREKQEMQERQFQLYQEQEMQRYDRDITDALTKSSLPKSPYVVKKMADYLLLALENGVDATAESILPLVEQEVQEDIKAMFAASPDDVLEKLIGKDVITKMRKNTLKKAPPQPVKSAVKDVGVDKKQSETKQTQKKSYKDFFGV
jgi:hypothetical protein